MAVLIYIHGFNSSERSHKANVLKQAAHSFHVEQAFISPRLSWQPKVAIQQLEALIEDNLSQGVTLIGSSLGGFYATYLTEKYGIKSILVNPAMQAPILLKDYLGPQRNPYTHDEYKLTNEHMAELEALVVTAPTSHHYWLMVQEGDEVLDYRAALHAFPNVAKLTHEKGGDHSFTDFQRFSTDIFRFAEIITN
ncbi:YqiA/YcfP family alpha/beta fold hydrolase [Marinomonas posidonica]|uniref:YqiA/YcfP family alpha/beta fold hydrolase n=1 Tax=Marinomonas posidonica TaxID=936476 RepID=UPI003736A704